MSNKYVYVLFDGNNDIGTFTSREKAVNAAIDAGLCDKYYNDEITTPEQVFGSDKNLLMVQQFPLNKIY